MRKTEVGIPKTCENAGVNMCNPILQAKILNAEHTDLNIVMGLCVGHDRYLFLQIFRRTDNYFGSKGSRAWAQSGRSYRTQQMVIITENYIRRNRKKVFNVIRLAQNHGFQRDFDHLCLCQKIYGRTWKSHAVASTSPREEVLRNDIRQQAAYM